MQIAARHSDRTKIQLPIQIVVPTPAGTQTLKAETLDASAFGARLSCSCDALSVGQTITVVYRQQECKFRVVWIGALGSPEERQAGIESLEPGKNVWGIEFQDNSSVLEPMLLGCPWEVPRAS